MLENIHRIVAGHERQDAYAEAFLRYGVVAVGWHMDDISNMTGEEIEKQASMRKYRNPKVAKDTLLRFRDKINIGDPVIAYKSPNTIVAVGRITSDYFYDNKDDLGSSDGLHFCHKRKVNWREKPRMFDRIFLPEDFRNVVSIPGTFKTLQYDFSKIEKTLDNVPETTESNIIRIRSNKSVIIESLPESFEKPDWLINLIDDIEILQKDKEHKERAHESLVEKFYELLGYARFIDIKHRQGRIDISIEHQGKIILVNEVKKDWNLSYKDKAVIIQAYNYSLESGARFVIVTNGDYYAIFDKDKGRSYESHFVGDFQLSKLKKDSLKLIDFLKKDYTTSY